MSSKPTRSTSPEAPGCFDSPVEISEFDGHGETSGWKFAPRPMDAGEVESLQHCSPAQPRSRCRFLRSRAYFERRHFEVAAAGFREVALDPNAGPDGPYAAVLSLESLNVLLSKAGRRSCVAQMRADTTQYLALYCEPSTTAPDHVCKVLRRVDFDLDRQAALDLIGRADRGAPRASALYRQGGEAYMQLFERRCRGATRKALRELGCDAVLYNAFMAFRAAGARERAAAARGTLLDPANLLHDSPLARRVGGLLY